MKKSRLVFTAIAVFAVAGSALALSPKTFGQGEIACIANGSSGTCPSVANYDIDQDSQTQLFCGTPSQQCNTQTRVVFVGL